MTGARRTAGGIGAVIALSEALLSGSWTARTAQAFETHTVRLSDTQAADSAGLLFALLVFLYILFGCPGWPAHWRFW